MTNIILITKAPGDYTVGQTRAVDLSDVKIVTIAEYDPDYSYEGYDSGEKWLLSQEAECFLMTAAS